MVTLGYGPRTAWRGYRLTFWSNNSRDSTWTPCNARTGVVRAPQGNIQCFSNPTGPVGGSQGTLMDTYGNRHNQNLRRIWPYGTRTGPVRPPHGMFTGCVWSLNLYGARRLITSILRAQYGEATFVRRRTGPYGPREWTYHLYSKQPGNSPYGARECDVTEASHHTPGPRTGCSRAVLNKNRRSTDGAHTGPLRRRTNFASPYRARRVLMYIS